MCEATPDATALIFGNAELTYRELDRLVDRAAGILIARGVGRGDLVGVALARGVDLIVALLAVMRVGAAYVGLDPDDPVERRNVLVARARIAYLVTGLEAEQVHVTEYGGASPGAGAPRCAIWLM